MSTHIKVGCKVATLHGHVCIIGIFELMVNLSTENALHCIFFFLNIGMKIHSCLNSLTCNNCVPCPRRMIVPPNRFVS